MQSVLLVIFKVEISSLFSSLILSNVCSTSLTSFDRLSFLKDRCPYSENSRHFECGIGLELLSKVEVCKIGRYCQLLALAVALGFFEEGDEFPLLPISVYESIPGLNQAK